MNSQKNQKQGEKAFGHPLVIIGTLIMVSVLIVGTILAIGVIKPMALRMQAEGTWTFWHEALVKAIGIALFAISYFGYTLARLPDQGWSWKKAAQAGVGAVITGILMGLAISMARR